MWVCLYICMYVVIPNPVAQGKLFLLLSSIGIFSVSSEVLVLVTFQGFESYRIAVGIK